MSVINQMLKDLEQRRQTPQQTDLSGVKATHVPKSHQNHFKRVLIVLLVIIVVLFGFLYWLWQQLPQHQTSNIVPMVQPSINTSNLAVASTEQKQLLPQLLKLQLVNDSVIFSADRPLQYAVLRRAKSNIDLVLYGVQYSKQWQQQDFNDNPLIKDIKIDRDGDNLIAHFQLHPGVNLEALQEDTTNDTASLAMLLKNNNPTITLVAQKPEIIRHEPKVLSSEAKIEKWYSAAVAAYENDDRVQTELLTQKILTLDNGNRLAAELLARLKFDEHQYQAALLALQKVVRPNINNDPQFYVLQANIYQELKRYALAARIYKQLTRVEPRNSHWWLGLAINLENAQQWQDARTAYQQAKQQVIAPELQEYVEQRIQALQG